MNITLNIDEEIVKKVRKIAIDKDTTLTAMVRDYLIERESCYAWIYAVWHHNGPNGLGSLVCHITV